MAKKSKEKLDFELSDEETVAAEGVPQKIQKKTKETQIAVEPVRENGVPFEIWFNIKKFKAHWAKPMKAFAQKQGQQNLTFKEWDELFSRY